MAAGAAPRLGSIGLVLGIVSSVVLYAFADLQPGRPEVTATAAVALLMAVWWITEAVPIAATALLPVVLFPLLGVISGRAVAAQYFNHVIFLFLGGFIVALAMERWDLHRRIALRVLLLFGAVPSRILLGFMVATAFLSMWISNTATTMMMVTIAIALLARIESENPGPAARGFSLALLLGVAYSASLGGIATLVGTPPNLSFRRILEIQFPGAPEVSFATWLAFAFPISVVFLVIVWAFLSWRYVPRAAELRIDRQMIRRRYVELGPLSFAEKVVLVDFLALVVLWLTRADFTIGAFHLPGWDGLFGHPDYLDDGTVAVFMAVLLFCVPARDGSGSRIMDWETAARLPWNIVLLFGGGFALAYGFKESGLDLWLGARLSGLGALDPHLLVIVTCLSISFLTELTSNTATAEMILPVMAGLSRSIGVNPLFLMVPVAISCSCAFMLPVATPPNAIVFGSGRLRMLDMAKAGILLNLVGALLVGLAVWLLGGAVLGIDLAEMPAWAR